MGDALLRMGLGKAQVGVARRPLWDVKVTWARGHDEDAHADVPEELRGAWASALATLNTELTHHAVRPYPTLPVEVPVGHADQSSAGIYATAALLFDHVEWIKAPPMPTVPKSTRRRTA